MEINSRGSWTCWDLVQRWRLSPFTTTDWNKQFPHFLAFGRLEKKRSTKILSHDIMLLRILFFFSNGPEIMTFFHTPKNCTIVAGWKFFPFWESKGALCPPMPPPRNMAARKIQGRTLTTIIRNHGMEYRFIHSNLPLKISAIHVGKWMVR